MRTLFSLCLAIFLFAVTPFTDGCPDLVFAAPKADTPSKDAQAKTPNKDRPAAGKDAGKPTEPKEQPAATMPEENKSGEDSKQTSEENVSAIIDRFISLFDIIEEKREQAAAWESAWANQHSMLERFRETANAIDTDFSANAAGLSIKVQSLDDEARRLLVLATSYKNWANPMEAVDRRITFCIEEIQALLEPLTDSHSQIQKRLDWLNTLADALPADLHEGASKSKDLKRYLTDVDQTRRKLMDVLARHDAAMSPALALIKRLQEAQKEIADRMPTLWENYYVQKPVEWLNYKETWANFFRHMKWAIAGMKLRMPVEIPVTMSQWATAGVRFVIGLAFCFVVWLFLYHKWHKNKEDGVERHLFRVSLPWLFLGLSLLASSYTASGDFFHCFLALGNICIILGQTLLAWDLRLLAHPEVTRQPAPLLRLMPLTCIAYLLLYLPIIRSLLLIFCIILFTAVIIWRRYWPPLSIAPLEMEGSIRAADGVVLWTCLVIALSGLPIMSLVTYLFFVSICTAIELSLGSMSRISYINENLPTDGIHAVIASLVVALAAPIVLVLAIVSVLLWIATLPGGMVLVKSYVFGNVSIGSTSFNLLQVLLIISVFFLTRAAIIMGSRFLSKLPNRGLRIDSSLIPPMQTAFTYAAWAVFGLFVLRFLGMELSNLAVVAGGLSVGIGFGMQAIVSNFISGLILIFGRLMQVGDVIEVKGITGRVCRINVRDTMIQTNDNAFIFVPNSEFISGHLINWSRNDSSVRTKIAVGVAYGSDTALVSRTLLAVANANSSVLKYPAPSVSFTEFADNTLNFELFFWVNEFNAKFGAASEIRLEIDRQFKEKHIEIAFPQMDVHVKELPPRGAPKRPPRGAGRSAKLGCRCRSVHRNGKGQKNLKENASSAPKKEEYAESTQ